MWVDRGYSTVLGGSVYEFDGCHHVAHVRVGGLLDPKQHIRVVGGEADQPRNVIESAVIDSVVQIGDDVVVCGAHSCIEHVRHAAAPPQAIGACWHSRHTVLRR